MNLVNQLINDDCFNVFPNIPDKSVDMILCDLPYGTTACKWDTILPLDKLWIEYMRIIKDNGAIVLTASQPFTTTLINSNIKWFKYEWIWIKSKPFDFMNAKNKPMKKHENIIVFSEGTVANKSKRLMPYYPQGLIQYNKMVKGVRNSEADKKGHKLSRPSNKEKYFKEFTNYPNTVLNFQSELKTTHPTQKPVPLFEYLIKTYTNEQAII